MSVPTLDHRWHTSQLLNSCAERMLYCFTRNIPKASWLVNLVYVIEAGRLEASELLAVLSVVAGNWSDATCAPDWAGSMETQFTVWAVGTPDFSPLVPHQT